MTLTDLGSLTFDTGGFAFSSASGAFSEITFTTGITTGGNFHRDGSGHLICDVEGIYICTWSIAWGSTSDTTKWWGWKFYRDDSTAPIKDMATRQISAGKQSGGNDYTIEEGGQITDYFHNGDQFHCIVGHDFGSSVNISATVYVRKFV